MKLKVFILSLILLLTAPAVGSAALLSGTYWNTFEANEIRFNLVDGGSLDIRIVFANPGDAAENWDSQITDGQRVVFGGPGEAAIVPHTGSFRVWFYDNSFFNFSSDNFDFTLEWAEYLNGSFLGSGDITYEDGEEVPSPVPLPTSAWMLISGLALFVGIRRHSAG